VGQYRVSLEQFTGPLDLLWHLIRTQEMDILDLDIARITDEYLRFIEERGVSSLADAYNFLAMAASLVELKSRLLLPQQQSETEGAEGEAALDPREELVQRLVAFRNIQDVTEELGRRFEETGRHWPRQVVEKLRGEVVYNIESLSAYDLMAVFADVLTRPKYQQVAIFREPYGLDEARAAVRRKVLAGGTDLRAVLSDQPDQLALIVTFLAVLELIREEVVGFEKQGQEVRLFALENAPSV
jgi:segregation and condensation protein A